MAEIEPTREILKAQDANPTLHEWSVKSALVCAGMIVAGVATAVISDNESVKIAGLATSLCASIISTMPVGYVATEKINNFYFRNIPQQTDQTKSPLTKHFPNP